MNKKGIFGKDKIASSVFTSFNAEREEVTQEQSSLSLDTQPEVVEVSEVNDEDIFAGAFGKTTVKVKPKPKLNLVENPALELKVQPKVTPKVQNQNVNNFKTQAINAELLKKVPIELQEEVNREIENDIHTVGSTLGIANQKQTTEFKIQLLQKQLKNYNNTVKHLEKTINSIKNENAKVISTLPQNIVDTVNNDIMNNVQNKITEILNTIKKELEIIIQNQNATKEAVVGVCNYLKVLLIKSKVNELEIGTLLYEEELDEHAISKMNTDLENLSSKTKQCSLGHILGLLESIQ